MDTIDQLISAVSNPAAGARERVRAILDAGIDGHVDGLYPEARRLFGFVRGLDDPRHVSLVDAQEVIGMAKAWVARVRSFGLTRAAPLVESSSSGQDTGVPSSTADVAGEAGSTPAGSPIFLHPTEAGIIEMAAARRAAAPPVVEGACDGVLEVDAETMAAIKAAAKSYITDDPEEGVAQARAYLAMNLRPEASQRARGHWVPQLLAAIDKREAEIAGLKQRAAKLASEVAESKRLASEGWEQRYSVAVDCSKGLNAAKAFMDFCDRHGWDVATASIGAGADVVRKHLRAAWWELWGNLRSAVERWGR